MTSEPTNKIVITKEELRDSKIDEAILLQRSAVPGAIEPVTQKSGFGLFYSAWFYLMLAGAIGAFTAWAFIEPYLEDGIIFTGKIEKVDAIDFPIQSPDGQTMYVRRLQISGMDVIVVAKITKIVKGATKNPLLYSADDLAEGQVVKVTAGAVPDQALLVADVLRLEPPETSAQTNLRVADLESSASFFSFALIPLIAGMIGLTIGAVEGIICRTFGRAIRSGLIGLIAGIIGGSLSFVIASIVYYMLGQLNEDPTASAGSFLLQMFSRGLAWTIAGTAMGLGQGVALKSRRLALNGLMGGMLGGLIGGLLFDPINLLFADRVLMEGAEVSRAIGFTVIGAAVGAMIGLTDLLTRNAWLRVVSGPLRGKEFNFYTTPIRLGSSPKNEIYLFKDLKIEPIHAQINKLRDTYEIIDDGSAHGTFVNGQRIKHHRLQDNDSIRIGDSEFVYATREKKS